MNPTATLDNVDRERVQALLTLAQRIGRAADRLAKTREIPAAWPFLLALLPLVDEEKLQAAASILEGTTNAASKLMDHAARSQLAALS